MGTVPCVLCLNVMMCCCGLTQQAAQHHTVHSPTSQLDRELEKKEVKPWVTSMYALLNLDDFLLRVTPIISRQI